MKSEICFLFQKLSYTSNETDKIIYPFDQNSILIGYDSLKTALCNLDIPRMTQEEYDKSTQEQLKVKLDKSIKADSPLIFPVSSPFLLNSYMLLDAFYEALYEYGQIFCGYGELSLKKYANTMAMRFYQNDSFLKKEDIPLIHFQTASERLDNIAYELKEFFSSAKKIRSSKIKNMLEDMVNFFKIIVTRCGKGLNYDLSLNDTEPTYRLKNSNIFKDFYLLSIVNNIVPVISFINKDAYNSYFKHLLTSIYFTFKYSDYTKNADIYMVNDVINQWKKKILSYIHNNNMQIYDEKFFESVSKNIPIPITPVFLYLAKLLQETLFNLNYHINKQKEIKNEFNTEKMDDTLAQWLLDYNEDYEITKDNLLDNPFLNVKSIKKNNNNVSFGCPFNLFYKSVSEIENILNKLFSKIKKNKGNADLCKYQELYILTDDENITNAKYNNDDLNIAKRKAIQQSKYDVPVFSGLLGLIPCEWEYVENKDNDIFSNTEVRSKLKISSYAKNGDVLTKLKRKDIEERRKETEEWRKIIKKYCQGNRDYAKDDLRCTFMTSCWARKDINDCKTEILNAVNRSLDNIRRLQNLKV